MARKKGEKAFHGKSKVDYAPWGTCYYRYYTNLEVSSKSLRLALSKATARLG